MNLGSVQGPFGIRSGSVRGPFGICLGQFRAQISGAKNSKFQNNFNLCGRRGRGGDPLAAVPSPAAWRAPAAAATSAQIENFCEKVGGRLDLGVGLRFPDLGVLRGGPP